ncbi:MFS transporter [Pseudomonas wadenswilerensis]
MDSNNNRLASFRREGTVVLLGSSLTIMGSVMIAPVLPKLFAEFGPDNPLAGALVPLAMTGPALAIALFAPLAGWLADRLGRKALLIIATLCYALIGAAPALLDDLGSIIGARLLFGCAEAAILTCCTTLIADYWEGQRRLQMINLQVITIAVIGASFFVLGGIAGEHSWRTPFYLYLLPLLLVPAMIKVLWEPRQQRPDECGDERPLSIPTLLIGYLLIFGGMLLNFIVPVQTPSLLVSIGVTSSTMIGLSAGLGLLATLAGSLIWPLMRRALGIAGCNALLLGLGGVGLWLLSHAQSYEQVLIAVVIHGVGAGMLVPNAIAPVMNTLNARNRGRGLGVFTACLCLGQFISPLLVVTLMNLGYNLRQAILAVAIAAGCAALAWLFTQLFHPRKALPING